MNNVGSAAGPRPDLVPPKANRVVQTGRLVCLNSPCLILKRKGKKRKRKTNLPPPHFIMVDTEVLLFCFVFLFLFSFLTFCNEELQPSTGAGDWRQVLGRRGDPAILWLRGGCAPARASQHLRLLEGFFPGPRRPFTQEFKTSQGSKWIPVCGGKRTRI